MSFDDAIVSGTDNSLLTTSETYPVIWTVTMTVTTPSEWLPSSISGTSTESATQDFKLTVTEPCTQYRIPLPLAAG